MADYIRGIVRQATPGIDGLEWRAPQATAGNDLKMSILREMDVSLDTTKLHLCVPLNGLEPYRVGHEIFEVRPGEYFALNPSQPVRGEGYLGGDVRGICLFLSLETLGEAAAGLGLTLEKSLDGPPGFPWQPQEFVLKKYKFCENGLGAYLQSVLPKILDEKRPVLMDWDAFYYDLAAAFLSSQQETRQQIRALPFVHHLTRQEVFKRLSLVRCFVLENHAQPISLAELEKIALISKFNLVRLYRAVYGVTPYQHILQLRVESAKSMLRNGYSPTEVAAALSFSDRRAFNKAFKKMAGSSPSAFQKGGQGNGIITEG